MKYLIHRKRLQDPCFLLLLQVAESAKKKTLISSINAWFCWHERIKLRIHTLVSLDRSLHWQTRWHCKKLLESITTWWAKTSVIKDTQVYFLKKKIHRYNTTVEYPFFLKKRVNWHRTYLLYYIITVLICSFLDTLAFILQPQIGI